MAEKLTRRELRSPDSFTRTAGNWLAWARQNPRETAIAIGGLVLVLLVLGFVVDRGSIRVDPVAGGALSEALALVDRPVGQEAGEGEESFASEAERRKALAEAFEAIRSNYGRSPAGLTATLALADVRYAEGDYDAALSLYESFLGKASADHSLRAFALEGKALALEGKGDLVGALVAFEEVAQAGLQSRALYGKARIYERQQKWDEAREAWTKLKEEHGLTPEGREANRRLARLDLTRPHGAKASEG
nr:MAG: hypothetical protein DIU72_08320 [Pseudomonadota bacterium]